jgi:cob(I)alamin adenosyltransferase
MPLYYTRAGDAGETGLFGTAERVGKASLRIEAIGQVDELQAFVGLARSVAKERKEKELDALLKQIQEHLFVLSADIASPVKVKIKRMSDGEVKWLEKAIDEAAKELKPLRNFIFPSGARLASILQICRAVARRGERHAAALNKREKINAQALAYLNRLSSFFFVLARLANKREGAEEEEWTP